MEWPLADAPFSALAWSTTLVIAVVYGWAGAKKGTATAARNDDLDGTPETFDTIQNLLSPE